MLRILILWELDLTLIILMVAVGEYVGLMLARRRGLTSNVSRLVTHGFLAAVSVIYAAGTFWTWRMLPHPESLAHSTAVNGAYLVIGVLAGLVAAYELWAHSRAMARKLTLSVPRLITHLVIFTLTVTLFGMATTRRQFYEEELERGYGAIPPSHTTAPPTP